MLTPYTRAHKYVIGAAVDNTHHGTGTAVVASDGLVYSMVSSTPSSPPPASCPHPYLSAPGLHSRQPALLGRIQPEVPRHQLQLFPTGEGLGLQLAARHRTSSPVRIRSYGAVV
jgi:hypothetical protein